ncbi:hypothetical protein ACFPRL_24665 [Pseudoclavibacter helvolus]
MTATPVGQPPKSTRPVFLARPATREESAGDCSPAAACTVPVRLPT